MQLVTRFQLLLAEMLLDEGRPEGMRPPCSQELIDEREKRKPRASTPRALQVCNGAVQAYLLMTTSTRPRRSAKLLLKLAPTP